MDNVKFIEDYFLGNLNDDELRDFHLRLENDDHFRSDYQLITEINECIAQDDVQELRNTLSGMFEKKKSNKTKLLRVARYTMAAAAVLLALVVWRLNKPVNVESLYSSFYQPYESDFITRDAEGEDNIQFGLLLYQDKEYENAYSIFENYLKENFNDQRIRFHAGLCALELEKYSNAVQLLEQVSADKNTIYQEHALWYLSLAYLKVEKLDEAYESLQIVANGNTLNKSKAEKLLSSSVFKKIN